MSRLWLTLPILFAFPLAGLAQETPRLAKERIILRTNAGDMLLALYPDVAPLHVEQILKLVRLGVYDSIHIPRVHPDFVAQLSDAQDRKVPLTAAQQAAIHPIPSEFSRLKHRKGTLSMARADGKPNSAETSFSILLGDSPHLDGQYTIFGQLEIGWEVLEQILAVPRGKNYQPLTRISINKAEVVDWPGTKNHPALPPPPPPPPPPHGVAINVPPAYGPDELASWNLAPAHQVPWDARALDQLLASAEKQSGKSSLIANDEDVRMLLVANGILVGTLILVVVMGLAGYFLYSRIPPRRMVSLILLMVLVSCFVLFIALVPLGHLDASGNLPIGLFVGLLGLFKLMGRFESPE